MTRHDMRTNVFLLLFEEIFFPNETEALLETAEQTDIVTLSPTVEAMFRGAVEHKDELDNIISKHLVRWSITRISKVSLAVLRLAVYELAILSEIEPPIVINEAVELTKEYASKEDASFVNGVLGSVVAANAEPVAEE